MRSCILDTNVLSELTAPVMHPRFAEWFRMQAEETLYITTLNVAEISNGIEQLPNGKKRDTLESWLDNILLVDFKNRLLDFDLKAAKAWGVIARIGKQTGRPRPYIDSLIAAIARANDMAIATRNTKDFANLGIELVNPFHD